MANIDRWTTEMQWIQESLVWLVPEAEMARTLVTQAGIPSEFIDFGEPVWNRIKRIMVEADKREMMPQLLKVITEWYPENTALSEAKAAWEAGSDRDRAASDLRRAAKSVREPVAVAKITRTEDNEISDVDVEVSIPPEEREEMEVEIVEVEEELEPVESSFLEIPYSDEMSAGDWFSTQKTMADLDRRVAELEKWRDRLSISPTPDNR